MNFECCKKRCFFYKFRKIVILEILNSIFEIYTFSHEYKNEK